MKKKIVLGLTALVVVAAMAIGGTLAFMTQKTAVMTNTFTAANGLSGEIREPAWDGFTFNDAAHDGTVAKDKDDTALGINKAKAMTPGLDIPKDPTIKNTSDVPVYMAIKVTYDDKAKFDEIATLLINSGWTASSESGIYFYTNTGDKLKEVTKDAATSALFDKVTIKTTATSETLKNNQFKITVTGGAVQTTNIDDATAKAQLINLLK